MSVFTDKKEYGGDIFTMLESTQSFVLNHINLKGEIKGPYRTDTCEIPVPPIREALINAVIHRDYVNCGRDIKVGIYDDIVNIVSPGGLPNTITIEDALNGRSEARNRVVAHVFKELGLIEQWGNGINRIVTACVEHGLQTPTIAEKNDFFDVELIRPRTITTDSQPETKGEQSELQLESNLVQPEFKNLLEQGIEREQQELQQEFKDRQPELRPESLYAAIVLKLAENNLSKQGLADALGHKSISGQLKLILSKLQEDSLIEWTIPEKPNSSKQKYKLTKRGLAFYVLVKRRGRNE
ncbi:ATP-binding protein [Mangrovibacterium lignilyticum]|uniref:ATP-binding protein n=1 Tax=Mangrovibacterium lignilyticum TaxID=2668052 RepID=UPI001966E00A|nr:ATP-binding protein [Mangrovibacterium lignilyticum]